MRFAITGVAGFVAPRHLKAIASVGGKLVAALDPHDAAGVLDRHGYDVEFFTAPERFERALYRLRREGHGIDWLTVCSPNHLHDAHTFMGLRNGANVICEKPLVLSTRNLDALEQMEQETERRVFTILQLRLHPKLVALKATLDANPRPREAVLTYRTPRGKWYHHSWKADVVRSGGLVTNIGIHLFDALLWLFGSVESSEVHAFGPDRAAGVLQFTRARVQWELDISPRAKPERSLSIDSETSVDFTDGFTDLHDTVYRETLLGHGFGIADARPSIELVQKLRSDS